MEIPQALRPVISSFRKQSF